MNQISVPKTWEYVKLHNKNFFKEVIGGGTPPRENPLFFGGVIPWVRLRDMKSKYITKTEETLTELGLQKSSARLLPKNTVILSTRATIGEVAINKTEMCTNQGFKSIICNENKVLPEYLYYFLKSIRTILQSKTKSTTYAEINKTNLESIQVPIPPISVQKEIIEKLDYVFSKFEEKKKVFLELQESIHNELQILPVRYKKHIINKLISLENCPIHWKIQRLDDVCERITDGAHKTPTYINEGIPFLRVKDIHEKNIDWNKTRKIPVSEHMELTKRCKPEFGDILYSKNGTIGISKVVDWKREFSIFVSLALLKPKKEILNPYFLKYFLDSDIAIEQATQRSKTATVTNLHLEEIREVKIPIPTLSEQKIIVNKIEKKLSDTLLIKPHLESIMAYRSKIEKYFEHINTSVLEQAFLGKLVN